MCADRDGGAQKRNEGDELVHCARSRLMSNLKPSPPANSPPAQEGFQVPPAAACVLVVVVVVLLRWILFDAVSSRTSFPSQRKAPRRKPSLSITTTGLENSFQVNSLHFCLLRSLRGLRLRSQVTPGLVHRTRKRPSSNLPTSGILPPGASLRKLLR